MSHLSEKKAALDLREADRKKADTEGIRAIARHFSTPEGREVFHLLCRKYGLLADRFQTNDRGEVNAVKAGIRDGEVRPLLFILRCMKESGETSITLPLS